MNFLNKKITAVPPISPATVAEIVGSIPKPPELRAAERNLADLREQRAELVRERGELYFVTSKTDTTERQMRDIGAEIERLQVLIVEARRKRDELTRP